MLSSEKKVRLKGLWGVLFFILFAIAIEFLGINLVINLYQYTETTIFVRGTLFMVIAPLSLVLVAVLSGYVLFTGKQAPPHIQKKLGKQILILIILSFLLSTLFSAFYTRNLEKEGYIRCSGVPIGYMPFMAVKFALDESLCKK